MALLRPELLRISPIVPESWDLAKSDWVSAEETEGNLITLNDGATYYSAYDIERYLDKVEAEMDAD